MKYTKEKITKMLLSVVATVAIIWVWVYATDIATKNTWDTLTAAGWNEVVAKINTLNTEVATLKAGSSTFKTVFTKCQMRRGTSGKVFPVCPSWYTSIHDYASFQAYATYGTYYAWTTVDDSWIASSNYGIQLCSVCKED